jgi:hypothetical protein
VRPDIILPAEWYTEAAIRQWQHLERSYGHHYDRSPTHDYEPTVELASDAA